MTSSGARRPALLAASLALALIAVDASPALAQMVDCNRIAMQLSSLARNPGSGRMQEAAQKQQAEIARTAAYARSIGCDKPQFLFFGSRPPQCEGINARIQSMQANYRQLLAAAGGDGGLRRQLENQYEVYCRGNSRQPNLLERLFGEPERTYPPENPDGMPRETDTDRRALGGSLAVCVRSCDGGFFPISYSARRADMGNLQDLCTALCPNTEAKVYTRSLSRDMKTAISADGEAYSDMPNAFKYEKTFDPACTCKPANQTWVEALAEAEKVLGETRKGDIIVTPEKSDEMARPKLPGAPAAAPTPKGRKFDAKSAQRLLEERKAADAQTEADRALAEKAPTASAESSGIDVGAVSATRPTQGELREEPDASGRRRKMRVLDAQ